MPYASSSDPVLDELRRRLELIYGDSIDRLILFGSRARGLASDDSDYDVAVFLKELPDRWEALHRLADLRFQMMTETGAFFDLLPYRATDYVQRTPLMREIRRDGIDL